MRKRHFAPDEMVAVEEVVLTFPRHPRAGTWLMRVTVRLMEWVLTREWWDARDESRRRKGLPL